MKLAIRTLIIAIVAVSVNVTAFAAGNVDKTVKEARAAVEAASPDDWHTYAKAAELCIAKGVNMKEAARWIKRSVEIRETVYNMKVLGNYYAANRLPKKAVEAYSKSIRIGKLTDNNYGDKETQDKIVSLVKQIG
jgi:hypothetical protein